MADLEPLIPAAVYEAAERAALRYVAKIDAFDVADDVLNTAIPLALAHELRKMADELEVVQQEMRETDASPSRSSGVGECIRHLRVRVDFLGRFL